MVNPLLKIGLTGGIASGKSAVSRKFVGLGIHIIDADNIARALVQPGQPAFLEIIQVFGTDLIQPDGFLNRAKLRTQIFTNSQQRHQLETILHPRIRQEMQQQVTQQQAPYCILSIPLLLETQQMDLVDRVLVVDCTTELQRTRLQHRHNSLTPDQIDQILATQATRPARLAIANDVIDNNSDLNYLKQQVITLHNFYLTLATKRIDN
jgi:dephospho-CoA kinase